MKKPVSICWFRRDLRLHDQAALSYALRSGVPVLPLFIFDRNILDDLKFIDDARVEFIQKTLTQLNNKLNVMDSGFLIKIGDPLEVWQSLITEYKISAVYFNIDFEPYAKSRDENVTSLLIKNGITVNTYKDHVIFSGQEVLKDDGLPYTVFTPYKRKWLHALSESDEQHLHQSPALESYPTNEYFSNFLCIRGLTIPALEEIGFTRSHIAIPQSEISEDLISQYDKTRNFPGIRGTSRLGIHFRFGTISIRAAARRAAQLSMTYLNELIWRDFYAMILDNFPHVVTRSFRAKYDRILWRNNEKEFEMWCEGRTGYPIVDAGMRELNQTGFIHNRARMIVASFLTKHLLIDWRWGEQYFAEKLLDFDLASNNGGWQWASGSGTDAAPYFRIFNPEAQMKKFDKELIYVKKWVPEYGTGAYVEPIVDHKFARQRCLDVYKSALSTIA